MKMVEEIALIIFLFLLSIYLITLILPESWLP